MVDPTNHRLLTQANASCAGVMLSSFANSTYWVTSWPTWSTVRGVHQRKAFASQIRSRFPGKTRGQVAALLLACTSFLTLSLPLCWIFLLSRFTTQPAQPRRPRQGFSYWVLHRAGTNPCVPTKALVTGPSRRRKPLRDTELKSLGSAEEMLNLRR